MTPVQEGKLLVKIKHIEGRNYCGWLTPVEVIHVVEKFSVILTEYEREQYERAKEKVKKGDCSAYWFYFQKKKE